MTYQTKTQEYLISAFFVTFYLFFPSNQCTIKVLRRHIKGGEILDNDVIKKLAVKAKHGKADAYGKLMDYYKEYLYKTAMLSVKNEDIAMDMVGECVLNGYRKIDTLKQPEYFKTWITRILFNTISDYYRSVQYVEDIDNIKMPDPEAPVTQEEKLDLYQAIDLLSEKYKKVIILKYFDDLKIQDIAYVMDIPEGSVKAYLHRAKKDLKHLLTEVDIYEYGIQEYGSTGKVG